MDDEILGKLDDISSNFQYLIDFLEDREANKKEASVDGLFDSFNNNFTDIGGYLKSIDSNIQNISAYIDNIPNSVNGVEDNDINALTNDTVINLIDKLDSLKDSIKDIGTNINIDIDVQKIEDIKKQLTSDLSLSINVENVDNIISDINNKLENLKNVELGITINKDIISNIEEISNDLEKIKDVNAKINFETNLDNIMKDIKDVDVKINFETNLTKIMNEINELKNIDLNNESKINFETNLSSIKEDLDNLMVDSESIDIKINIENVINKIETVKTELTQLNNIETNFKIDFDSNIDDILVNINNKLSDISKSIFLDIEANIRYKIDEKSLQEVKANMDNIELTINPDSDLINNIQSLLKDSEFDIKINPILDLSEYELNSKIEYDIKYIKEDNSNENDDKILIALQQNNDILNKLVNILSENKPINNEIVNVLPETKEKQSIVNINNETVEQSKDIDFKEIVSVLNIISKNTSKMVSNSKKSAFSTNDSDY